METTQRKYAVKRKLSRGLTVFRKWEDWEVGDVVIGEIEGVRIDNYDKANVIIKVEDAFLKKEDKGKYIGKSLALNGCGKLYAALVKFNEVGEPLLKVEEGTVVQVTYKGQSMIDSGKFKGKQAHDVEVEELVEETDEEVEL